MILNYVFQHSSRMLSVRSNKIYYITKIQNIFISFSRLSFNKSTINKNDEIYFINLPANESNW